jgi:taurine transport system substrate-binding protein
VNFMLSTSFRLSHIFKQRFSKFLSFIALTALCFVFFVTACTTNKPSLVEPTELKVGFQVVPNAEVLAKALKLVEKRMPNTKVRWLSFDSGRDVNTAMAANGIDLGESGSVPTSTGIAQKLPYQVYFIQYLVGDNEALVVRKSGTAKTLVDVKGKKIAVPFGSTSHFSFLSALKQQGIKESELKIIDMQPPDMLAAWQRGDIDGGFVWQPTLAKMINSGGRVMVTAKTLAAKGIVTADLALVHKNLLNQYPEAVTQYVSAMNEAVQFYRDKPEEAAKAIAPELGLSPAESLKVMNELIWLSPLEQTDAKYLGKPGQPGALAKVLKETADFMVTQKVIPSAPDIGAYEQAIYNGAIYKVAQAK